jgi:type I restriction enzyme S subunit
MTGSAGQKRVSTNFFNLLKVPVPPIELQEKFAKIVEKVEELKNIEKKSLIESENLFDSLMQKAFKGELI